jgi:hypothetical protein
MANKQEKLEMFKKIAAELTAKAIKEGHAESFFCFVHDDKDGVLMLEPSTLVPSSSKPLSWDSNLYYVIGQTSGSPDIVPVTF